MTFRDYFITTFDGMMLHNGTTMVSVNRIQQVSRVMTQILTLPDGSKYDNTPAADTAPLVPGTVSQEIIVTGQTWATKQTLVGNIAAKLGRRGLLTFKYTDSATTFTATARMTGLQNVTPPGLPAEKESLRLMLTFELLNNPA